MHILFHSCTVKFRCLFLQKHILSVYTSLKVSFWQWFTGKAIFQLLFDEILSYIQNNFGKFKLDYQSVLRTAARTGDFFSPAFCSVKDLVQAVSIAPYQTKIIKLHQHHLKVCLSSGKKDISCKKITFYTCGFANLCYI